MTGCVFCEIVSGLSPASIVYRDADLVAFMDIQPIVPGHLLVIPIQHAPYMADIDEHVAASLMCAAHRLAAAARRSGLRCEGVNLFLADGAAAFQEVFHVHLHVIPRHAGDGFGLVFPADYTERPSRAQLDDHGAKIRQALEITT